MARRHWRFVVRDQYGFVIQNAKVNVFQPGTTTDFVGSAFTAASGGSAVTNPLTTNAFGEVEAWFDTAQTVDVRVDDNTNLAYRAVGGVSDLSDFPTFTEADDIYVSADDQAEETDLPIAHGAAEHTNITRHIWLPAESAALIDGATASTLGTAPNNVRTIQLDDAVTEGVSWTFEVPEDYASGVITASVFWSPSATVAASKVRWQYVAKVLDAGGDVTAAGTTTAFDGATSTHTANIQYEDTATSTGVTPSAGDGFLLNVRRIGGDAGDTLNASIVHLLGVLITYTANQ